MGYLWANMEKIDVQASEAALTAAENRAKNAENRAKGAETEIERLKALLAVHGIEMPES